MAIKIFPYLFALFALLFVVQAAPSDISELPDILYIESPALLPAVLSAQEPQGPAQRNRVCIPARCARICRWLGYHKSHCNAHGICICSKL